MNIHGSVKQNYKKSNAKQVYIVTHKGKRQTILGKLYYRVI